VGDDLLWVLIVWDPEARVIQQPESFFPGFVRWIIRSTLGNVWTQLGVKFAATIFWFFVEPTWLAPPHHNPICLPDCVIHFDSESSFAAIRALRPPQKGLDYTLPSGHCFHLEPCRADVARTRRALL
jgi:hypothetical protein